MTTKIEFQRDYLHEYCIGQTTVLISKESSTSCRVGGEVSHQHLLSDDKLMWVKYSP